MSSANDTTWPPRMNPAARAVKWVGDRVMALVMLVLLSPLLAVLAVWVLIDDGRPVLFVQRRVGRRGRVFPMLKFRSMVNNAVELAQGITDDPHGVVRNDPRITPSGRFLRRSGLDELPQLFNVLVGQMSFIGPRPDIPEQVAHYSASDRRRLDVLPGISGYSQVHGRDEIEWPERIAQDVWYIEHWSLALEARIAWRTLFAFGRDEPDPVHDAHNVERATAVADRAGDD
jgi:lipopolysaccharide/colanic/teichoic acid biosynthesis glycosyltransferase